MLYSTNITRRNPDFRSWFRRLFRLGEPPPHSSHFAEFGAAASGILHDLSNPLTVLRMSIEHLKNDVRLRNTRARKHIEAAFRAERKMALFLSSAKKQLGRRIEKPFDAAREIRNSVKLLHAFCRKSNVKIKFRSKRAVFICGDSLKFFRVVSNIIANAVDSYATFPAHQNKIIIVRIKQDREEIIISIRDFGCGIPKHLHKKIFEPFYSTKQKHEGAAGLGLSIVKNLIENDFDGKIKLDSAPGRGSVFKIIMPNRSKALE